MVSLKERWKAFIKIVLDPVVFVLFPITAFLTWVLVGQTDRLIVVSLTLIISLLSGVLGGVLATKWEALTEKQVVETRGRSAVRSLKLLLGNIVALERRVNGYLKRQTDESQRENQTPEVIKTYLEEVIARCLVLEDEVISSIENWTDIVPGADIKTQIGLIGELTSQIQQLMSNIQDLTSELEVTKGESREEAKRLRAEIEKKEDQLRETKRELRQRRISITGSIVDAGSYFKVKPEPLSLSSVAV